MIPISRNKFTSVIIQVLIWLCFSVALFLSQPLSWGIQIPAAFWVKQAATVVLLVSAYYVNSRLLVPRLLLRHRIWLFLTGVVALAGAAILISSWLDAWLHIPQIMEAAFHHHGPPNGDADFHKRHPGNANRHGFHFDGFTFVITALILGISTSVTAVQKWQHDNQLHQELKQQRTDSELSFLKAQINPHFFFNTLNNIYMLTMIDVESSRQALHKLSRMMRYILYETQHDTTLLSKELDFIKDYIELMRLRLTDKVSLHYRQPEQLKDGPIAPMLFLPFVENAFKHGVSAMQQSTISIILTQQGTTLSFEVNNTIVTDEEKTLDGNSGIGLTNTKRRLELLYPGKHMLKINHDKAAHQYSVHLNLQLL